MRPEVDDSISRKRVSLPKRDYISTDFSSPSERLEMLTESERQTIEDWDDLPESIYSIFFVSTVFSTSFFFAAVVFIFQTAMASLVLVDLIEFGTPNPLHVPPGVTSTVRAGQGLALTLAVLVQGDIKQSVQTLHSGYDSSVLKLSSSATFAKWLVAYILQFCVGAIMLSVIFTLIVRSRAVIEIFLNFAALLFITEIDDVAFLLAKHGYITGKIKDVCDTIQEYKTPPESTSLLARRIVIVTVILGMFGGWIDIIVKQNRGAYLCKSLLVQFGDDFIGFLPTFSGSYDIVHDIVRDGRAVYTSRGFSGDRLSAFRYCRDEKMWIFGAVTGPAVNLDNLCYHWLLRTTAETTTFDVTTIPITSWLTRQIEIEGLTFPVGHLFLECNDCSSLTCQGTCVGNACVCPPNGFGDRCEFDSPCPNIDLDRRTPRFEALAVSTFLGGRIPTSYNILMTDNGNASVPVRVYNRPVYFNNNSNKSKFDAIFFNGRRWVFYDSTEFEGSTVQSRLTNVTTATGLAAILSSTNQTNPFHAFYDVVIPRFSPLFISSPLDIGTASNAISPATLAWFGRGTNKEQGFAVGRPIESRFLCTTCDDSNTCLNFGQCIEGRCRCMFSTSGDLCELLESCVDRGCQNGGQCNQGSGLCSCPPQFSGNLCLAQSCGDNGVICFNNGTCNQDNTGCDCPLNFGGFRCNAFDCNLSGCRNGGTCGPLGLECECLSGFGGLSCEIPITRTL